MTDLWRTPEIEERLALRRRRVFLIGAALVGFFFVDDVLSGHAGAGKLVFIRACWSASLLIVALTMVRASPRDRRLLVRLAAIVCGASFSAMALVRNDQHSAYFAFQLAVPLAFVLVFQDEVAAVLLCSLATFIGTLVFLVLGHSSPPDMVQWLSTVAASGFMAVYASHHQRAQLREESTQQQRLAISEAGRAEAERMALVGQLAAGVAHEINNPLAFVISNLSFLEGEFTTPSPDAAERSAVLAETELGLRRIKAIVSDLTAFSRVSEEQTTEVDLNAVVSEAERIALGWIHGRVGIINELPADMRRVVGNQRHLGQVFLNLMINAADARGAALPPGGRLWIRASMAGDKLEIEVDDNGPGFSPAVLASLFQPFFTTKAPGKGTGLGLATSREYLRRAGGDLIASQRPGGGARFTLALRCAPVRSTAEMG